MNELLNIDNNWIPAVEEKTYHGVDTICLRTRLFSSRKLFLVGKITDEMANDFVAEILYLTEKNEPISIYINSPGGLVNAGLVIYDIIQACKDKIDIDMYCTGTAASMAAIIFASGKKGHRYILPHSKVMIHEPLIADGMGGSATTIKKTADSILETKELTVKILAEHTGKTMEEIDKAISFDNYMNAQEAIEFGLCDEIRNIL